VPELDASYRAPVRSPVPALLVSGTLDGRTPVANAEAALRGLPNGAHLVVAGRRTATTCSSPRPRSPG
jgi:pimeloyl-ACP methyl ester carboxylesterase